MFKSANQIKKQLIQQSDNCKYYGLTQHNSKNEYLLLPFLEKNSMLSINELFLLFAVHSKIFGFSSF
jgi:hypothetical protein